MSAAIATEVPSTSSRRCLDADEVAAKYRMSRRQVFRAADALMIPPGFKVGRLRRWDETEVDRHIAAGCPPLRRGGRR
jgi:predicted DNA-binding transcriptional regulator AlpA